MIAIVINGKMLFCDPEFIFTERMKATMSKAAFAGLRQWHEDTVSGLLDDATKVVCKYCKLDPCFLEECYPRVFLEVGLDCEEQGSTNKEIRFNMYCEASSMWSGHPGRGKRFKLPHCVVSNIHDAYPSSDGAYVGFKKGSKGGDEESVDEDDKKPEAKPEAPVDRKRKTVAKITAYVQPPHGLPNSNNPYGLDYYADIEAKYPEHACMTGGDSDTTEEREWVGKDEEEDPDNPSNDKDKKQPPPFMPLTQEPMRKTMKYETPERNKKMKPMAN